LHLPKADRVPGTFDPKQARDRQTRPADSPIDSKGPELDSPKSPKLKGPRALPPGSRGVLEDWGLGTIVIALVNTPSGPQKDPFDAAADLETDQKRADYSGAERATNEPPQLRALRINLQLSLVREFRR
jgi:hypothetical protein